MLALDARYLHGYLYLYLYLHLYLHLYLYLYLYLRVTVCICLCICLYTYDICVYDSYIQSTSKNAETTILYIRPLRLQILNLLGECVFKASFKLFQTRLEINQDLNSLNIEKNFLGNEAPRPRSGQRVVYVCTCSCMQIISPVLYDLS